MSELISFRPELEHWQRENMTPSPFYITLLWPTSASWRQDLAQTAIKLSNGNTEILRKYHYFV